MEPLAPTEGTGVSPPAPPSLPPPDPGDLWALVWLDLLTCTLCLVWLAAALGVTTLLCSAALWLLAPPARRLCALLGCDEPRWLTDAEPLAVLLLLIVERLLWGPWVPLERLVRWLWRRLRAADTWAWSWLHRARR